MHNGFASIRGVKVGVRVRVWGRVRVWVRVREWVVGGHGDVGGGEGGEMELSYVWRQP